MNVAQERTTPVVSQIEELVRDIPGWTPLDQLYTLFTLIYTAAGVEGDILEIGSWCGRSASVLALAARMTGVRTVHCIDLFPAREDWEVTAEGHHVFRVRVEGRVIEGYTSFGGVWPEPFERDIAPIYEKHDGVYDAFRDTLARKGFSDIVKPYRGTSDMFAAAAPSGMHCKFAFIDGDHGYDAVCADIRNVDRFLVPGGWIAFDDAFAAYDGVSRAVNELIVESPRYELGQQMARKLFVARKRLAPGQ